MKVLFICLSNINRSQFSEAFFRKFAPDHVAMSAGAHVVAEREDRPIGEIDELPIQVMAELGYDLAAHRAKQVTQAMIDSADKVISLTAKGELPDFVQSSPKLELWAMPDPGGKGIDVLRATRDTLHDRVRTLAAQCEPAANK